uniref:Uncharacterized protein n=1 Tax=uncultured marine virus TaxID=186617 RepID=A0A0F7L343_9VIRU|nr:hypothetical protein [uncultured marine virus]
MDLGGVNYDVLTISALALVLVHYGVPIFVMTDFDENHHQVYALCAFLHFASLCGTSISS